MSYKLTGVQRDLLTSYAIHQDADSIINFVESTVDEQAGKPLPPDDGLDATPTESDLVMALRAWKSA